MRCLLLLIPINLKKYLIDIIERPAESVDPKEVGFKVIKQMKLIKFALFMLHPNDLHIKQVSVSLGSIEKYAKDMMEFCGCYQDFIKILF